MLRRCLSERMTSCGRTVDGPFVQNVLSMLTVVELKNVVLYAERRQGTIEMTLT